MSLNESGKVAPGVAYGLQPVLGVVDGGAGRWRRRSCAPQDLDELKLVEFELQRRGGMVGAGASLPVFLGGAPGVTFNLVCFLLSRGYFSASVKKLKV